MFTEDFCPFLNSLKEYIRIENFAIPTRDKLRIAIDAKPMFVITHKQREQLFLYIYVYIYVNMADFFLPVNLFSGFTSVSTRCGEITGGNEKS